MSVGSNSFLIMTSDRCQNEAFIKPLEVLYQIICQIIIFLTYLVKNRFPLSTQPLSQLYLLFQLLKYVQLKKYKPIIYTQIT